jgi:hypothetical protein
VEYPPRQRAASFTIDQVMEKLQRQGAAINENKWGADAAAARCLFRSIASCLGGFCKERPAVWLRLP